MQMRQFLPCVLLFTIVPELERVHTKLTDVRAYLGSLPTDVALGAAS